MLKPILVRQLFVLFVIGIIGFLIAREILPYLTGLLGAITLYVILIGPMNRMVAKGMKKGLSAILLMILSFILILIPIGGLGIMLGNKIGRAVKHTEKASIALKQQIANLETRFNLDLAEQIDTGKIASVVSHNLQSIAGSTVNILISIAIMYLLLYYMLIYSKNMVDTFYNYLPFKKENLKIIGEAINKMVKSNAIGIPVVAFAQGIVALIGYLIFGVQDPWFWFVITAIGSMIPVVGTMVGILPVFLITLSTGDAFSAWGILIYGFAVVGVSDNIVRLYALKRLDDVHPLITLMGVIIGVPLFGFIGLIFGPILLSLFIILVRVYRKEYIDELEEA